MPKQVFIDWLIHKLGGKTQSEYSSLTEKYLDADNKYSELKKSVPHQIAEAKETAEPKLSELVSKLEKENYYLRIELSSLHSGVLTRWCDNPLWKRRHHWAAMDQEIDHVELYNAFRYKAGLEPIKEKP